MKELYEFRIYQDEYDTWQVERKVEFQATWFKKSTQGWRELYGSQSKVKLDSLKTTKRWILTNKKRDAGPNYSYFSETTIDQLIAEEEAKVK